jgi:hypothetical protein
VKRSKEELSPKPRDFEIPIKINLENTIKEQQYIEPEPKQEPLNVDRKPKPTTNTQPRPHTNPVIVDSSQK